MALLVVVGCGLLWVIGAAHRSSGGATTVGTEPDNISAFEICKQFNRSIDGAGNRRWQRWQP